jgi:hypothetical protein
LSGAADFGEQHAEATQAARDEIQKRLVEDQQRQAFQQQQREAQLRYHLEQQPVPIDKPFVAGGKTYQRFQNPLNGTMSLQELPGPLAETPEEQQWRGYKAMGFSDEQIRDMVEKSNVGRNPQIAKVDWQDANGNWFKKTYNAISGEVYSLEPEATPSAWAPRYSFGSSTDPNTLLPMPRSSVSGRFMPGQPVPGMPPFLARRQQLPPARQARWG